MKTIDLTDELNIKECNILRIIKLKKYSTEEQPLLGAYLLYIRSNSCNEIDEIDNVIISEFQSKYDSVSISRSDKLNYKSKFHEIVKSFENDEYIPSLFPSQFRTSLDTINLPFEQQLDTNEYVKQTIIVDIEFLIFCNNIESIRYFKNSFLRNPPLLFEFPHELNNMMDSIKSISEYIDFMEVSNKVSNNK